MKSFIFISAVATAALAQSSNVFIPQGISEGCTTFLQDLDKDSSLTACTTSINVATSQFGPGQSTTPSSASISSALGNVCSDSTATCNKQTIGAKLSSFYSACSAELTSSPNPDVMRTYDVLYSLIPFKGAICCKSDNGKYCVTQESSSSSSFNKRASPQTPAIIPNTTTYRESNLLFLFLTPQTPSSQLCTTCTRNVLMSYIEFETSVLYAPGISKSPLMGGQPDLYNAVQNTCGKSFFTGAAQAAGGISKGVLGDSNAAPRSASQGFMGILTGALAGVALVVTAVL